MEAMREPVMFIQTDDDGKFTVTKEAASILKRIDKPAVVIAIAGKYRTGKSYIMNRLFGKSNGFALGPTVQSQTKGFWIWCRPHPNNRDEWLILLDTEGLSDVERGDRTHDTKLFSLAILLSGCLLYNSFGTIDNEALQQLHFVTELTEHIKIRADEDEEGNDFDKYFPMFFWIVRDFTLTLEIDGKPCTEDDYLERALKQKNGLSKATEEFNRPRKYIRDFFPNRKCFVLCKPVDDDEKLKHLETVKEHELRSSFVKHANELCKTVLKEVKTFNVGTTPITGSRLLFLAQKYTDAINNGAVPCIGTAVDLMRDTECQKAVDMAVETYEQEMKTVSSKMPMTSDSLSTENQRVQTTANNVYHQNAMLDQQGTYQTKLLEILNDRFNTYFKLNEQRSQSYCRHVFEDCVQQLKLNIQQGMYTGKGCYQLYMRDLDEAVRRYHTIPNRGPCAEEMLTELLKSREAEGMTILESDKAMTEKEKEIAVMNEQRKQAMLAIKASEEKTARVEQKLIDTERNNLIMMQQAKDEFNRKMQEVETNCQQTLENRDREYKRLMEEGLKTQAEMHKEEVEILRQDKKELMHAHQQKMSEINEAVHRQETLVGDFMKQRQQDQAEFNKRMEEAQKQNQLTLQSRDREYERRDEMYRKEMKEMRKDNEQKMNDVLRRSEPKQEKSDFVDTVFAAVGGFFKGVAKTALKLIF